MKLNKAFGSLFLLASLVFVPPVFAGGGGVYVDVTKTDDPLANIVRVYINPALYTCKGINVSLSFLVPEDGDRISGSDSNGSSTINNDPEYASINGKEYLRCSTYLKVYTAHTKLNRILNIYLKGMAGESRQIAFSAGYEPDYNSSLLLPWEDSNYSAPVPQPSNEPVPSANINVWLLDQRFVGQNKREVTVKWGAFGGHSGTFTIYAKQANKNDWDEKFDGSKGPSATFNIKANQDYQIKVNGCMDKWGICVDSNIINLPGAKDDIAYQDFHPKNDVSYVSPTPTADNNNVDQLNEQSSSLSKKVENLQNQLDQSKKTQGVLEQRINDLVNFIKRLFPFFK